MDKSRRFSSPNKSISRNEIPAPDAEYDSQDTQNSGGENEEECHDHVNELVDFSETSVKFSKINIMMIYILSKYGCNKCLNRNHDLRKKKQMIKKGLH